jgi:hypothetical protein
VTGSELKKINKPLKRFLLCGTCFLPVSWGCPTSARAKRA